MTIRYGYYFKNVRDPFNLYMNFTDSSLSPDPKMSSMLYRGKKEDGAEHECIILFTDTQTDLLSLNFKKATNLVTDNVGDTIFTPRTVFERQRGKSRFALIDLRR